MCAADSRYSNGFSGRSAVLALWPARTIYAREKLTYPIERYLNETGRLYAVLNKRLADRAFVAGDYSIADMAAYPWIVPHENQGQKLEDFPALV
jgi:GSH-dependent disulfide-bond oxidoreductase